MNPQKKIAGRRNTQFAHCNFQFSRTSKPQTDSTRPPLPPLPKGGRTRCVPLRAHNRRGVPADRQGSVLIVVIGLLLLMMLVGFTFFTFANQEHGSAEYYADSAKVFSVSPDVNALFDYGLEQLIIGPRENNRQSVLWPGKSSLVPNMLGLFGVNPQGTNLTTVPTDRHPYNGTGINIAAGTKGQPFVDLNFDGVPDAGNGHFLALNWSPAATVGLGSPSRTQIFNKFFIDASGGPVGIDAGYTYPDINSPFLAFAEPVPQVFDGSAAGTMVLIPSFHRPQYLRDPNNGSPLFNRSSPQLNWYNDNSGGATDTTNRVFCPHPGHVCVNANGMPVIINGNVVPRYLQPPQAPVVISATHTIQPFNFAVDSNGNGTPGEMGIWAKLPKTSTTSFDYPVDNNNDGTFDSVWLDLNYPWSTLQDGRISVPLFSYMVVELDSLINLNTAGNLTAFTQIAHPLTGSTLALMGTSSTPISRSNLGVTPSEINPFWALVTDPTNSSFLNPPNVFNNPSPALQQYRGFFNQGNNPGNFVVDRVEAANMDMLFLLWGRPSYSVTSVAGQESYTLNNLAGGLWGEASSLYSALVNNGNGYPYDLSQFPRPGNPGTDDDGDQFAGVHESENTYLGQNTLIPPFSQPLDFTGGGQWLRPGIGNGLLPNLFGLTSNPQPAFAPFLQYTGYQPQLFPFTPPVPPATYQFAPSMTYNTMGVYQGVRLGAVPPGTALSQNPYILYNFNSFNLIGEDEADEVVTDRRYQQSSDQLFTPDEIAALQLAQPDYLAGLGQSRVRQLASLNFELNQQAAQIRKRFTTESWDRVNHSFAYNSARPWEYGFDPNNSNNPGNTWDNSGGNQFPPMVVGNPVSGLSPNNANVPNNNNNQKAEPFRLEVAALIGARLNNGIYDVTGANVSNANAFNTPPYNLSSGSNSQPWQQQFRMNINRFVSAADPTNPLGPGGTYNPVVQRELTPHPAQLSSGVIPTASPNGSVTLDVNSNSWSPQLQEYWARRDRQQLARDIYVMLYMFGGGDDTQNYAKNSNALPKTVVNDPNDPNNTGQLKLRPLYNDMQLREMAQFAVNYVDALDRDDTITVFEYDRDLSNGWNLDDNPFTSTDAIAAADRDVVYGVEAQSLALNEAQIIVSPIVKDNGKPVQQVQDHPATYFDDSVGDRYFTYLELLNAGPYSVSVANSTWQIQAIITVANTDTVLSTLILGGPTPNAALDTIGAAQTYTIGSRSVLGGVGEYISGTNPQPSYFKVIPNWDWTQSNPPPPQPFASYQTIAPASGNLNLDLVAQSGNNRFWLTDSTGKNTSTNGNLFCDLNTQFGGDIIKNGGTALPYTVKFSLQRRLNINRAAPAFTQAKGYTNTAENLDNPFIEVDRISYTIPAFQPDTAQQALNTPQGGLFNLRWKDDLKSPGSSWPSFATDDIIPKLQRLTSWERKQPLDGFEGNAQYKTSRVKYYATPSTVNPPLPSPVPTTSIIANSLGQMNYWTNQPVTMGGLGGNYTLWQPHFDRDFASVMELLSVPLYGPGQVTPKVDTVNQLVIPTGGLMIPTGGLTQSMAPRDVAGSNAMAAEVPLVPTVGNSYMPLVAQAKFFRPQNPYNVAPPQPPTPQPAIPQLDNRWHRILELLEVPSRENMWVETTYLQQQKNYTWLLPHGLQRVPGKMNLNGTRYAETFFALLDDPNTFDPFGYNPDGSYSDRDEPPSNGKINKPVRNWWFELVATRDGIRTNTPPPDAQPDAQTGFYSPGAPGTQPFRSFGSAQRNPNNYTPITGYATPNSADDTLLRTMLNIDEVTTPMPPPPSPVPPQFLDQRRLFEARAEKDRISQGGTASVDYYTRNRILSKIAGNTTNRSNVFAVWMTVGFFEGYQPDPANNPNVVQIGAEMTDQTRRRGFFVVDRSVLEDAWNPTTGTYDFHKFIQYRKTIQ